MIINEKMDEKCFGLCDFFPTLNNWTPITANINCSKHVTSTIFPIVFTATITHCTTCYVTFNKDFLYAFEIIRKK